MKAQWFRLSWQEIVTWSRCGAVLHDVRLPLADGVQKGMRRRDDVVRHPAVLGHALEKQRRRHTELWKVKIDSLGSWVFLHFGESWKRNRCERRERLTSCSGETWSILSSGAMTRQIHSLLSPEIDELSSSLSLSKLVGPVVQPFSQFENNPCIFGCADFPLSSIQGKFGSGWIDGIERDE